MAGVGYSMLVQGPGAPISILADNFELRLEAVLRKSGFASVFAQFDINRMNCGLRVRTRGNFLPDRVAIPSNRPAVQIHFSDPTVDTKARDLEVRRKCAKPP